MVDMEDKLTDKLSEKVETLAERAGEAVDKIGIKRQIEERPFTMLAVSLAAGFATGRLVLPRRREEAIRLSRDETKKKKRKAKKRKEEAHDDGGGRMHGAVDFVKDMATHGQETAGVLARAVIAKLLSKPVVEAARSVVSH
jgi:hypothetical protein